MKTVQVPASEKEIVDRVTCDLCGEEISPEKYSAESVDVKHRTGSNYPEGGNGLEVSVDMCGKCFDEKLVPWLRSQGVEPRTSDWEW